VRVADQVVGALRSPGLLVLLGVTHTDTSQTARTLAAKLWRLRILRGEVSAEEAGAPLLVVSQFTLYADTRKGRRPSWSAAAPSAAAEICYADFVSSLRDLGAHVETGVFGAAMSVELVNEGPFTVLLEV
jgi:D-tyrosyl-tRNA(Tyr) deacylase